jgi:hypothetical protein
MIIDDDSQEISVRRIDFISLMDNKIIFHLKSTQTKQVKTYNSVDEAKEEFAKLSRRIEHYHIVKSGRPLA